MIHTSKIFILLVYFFIPLSVFAAGGGGGGSVPSCEQDTWLCTEWSECSSQGVQKRTCSLSFDCPSIETPKPIDSQSCTPPCTDDTWQCSEWSACIDEKENRICTLTFDCNNTQNIKPIEERQCEIQETSKTNETRNPFEPKEEPKVEPVKNGTEKNKQTCKFDRWDCGPWDEVCDTYGNQKRTCKMTLDCPNVNTPAPQFFKRCEKLQCGNIENINDRVHCRLNLSPASISREYEIEYLPEECRFIKHISKRKSCIELYKSYKPCWNKPIGESRSVCAKGVLGLGQNISQFMALCLQQNGKNNERCKLEHKQKVYELIKFRFYDLEERAEDIIKDGAPKDIVADFVVLITEKKNEFNNAKTKDERKKIIMDVKEGWKRFLKNVKTKVTF